MRRGSAAEGLALLDEALAEAITDELVPGMTGNIFCHVIAACWELGDLRRAAAAAAATERWLARLPAAALFSGICRVHRAQLLQAAGAWANAECEAARVAVEVAHLQVATAAEGHYAVGDVRAPARRPRRREQAYAEAHRLGRDPQPGLALLRLAQGRRAEAAAAVRTALTAAVGSPLSRHRLAAQVEIALAVDDVATARAAAQELEETAGLPACARGPRRLPILRKWGVAADPASPEEPP